MNFDIVRIGTYTPNCQVQRCAILSKIESQTYSQLPLVFNNMEENNNFLLICKTLLIIIVYIVSLFKPNKNKEFVILHNYFS